MTLPRNQAYTFSPDSWSQFADLLTSRRQGYMVLMDEENICTSLASFEGIDPCVEVF